MGRVKAWLMAARNSRKKYIVTVVLFILVIILGWRCYEKGEAKKPLNYPDCLDKKAVRVNDTELTLRDLAFYVAYEEGEVEKQAEVYDPDDPNSYWNVHTDGQFVKVAARNAAIQLAIHDEIFYQLAEADHTTLTEEEQESLDNSISDFWSDLTDREGDAGLGVTREDIAAAMKRAAIAQKYQYIYEELMGADHGDYDCYGDAYEALRDKQKCTIYKNVWSRVNFGRVTVHPVQS